MSLLEIFMIEDFCNSVENTNVGTESKGIGLFGFIIMVLVFAFARDYIAVRFAQYLYPLGLSIVVLTILIPLFIKKGIRKIPIFLFIADVVIGFIFYSVLMVDIMQGAPVYTIVQEVKAIIDTVSIKFIQTIVDILFWFLSVAAFILDVMVIPLGITPFIQRFIWKKILHSNK